MVGKGFSMVLNFTSHGTIRKSLPKSPYPTNGWRFREGSLLEPPWRGPVAGKVSHGLHATCYTPPKFKEAKVPEKWWCKIWKTNTPQAAFPFWGSCGNFWGVKCKLFAFAEGKENQVSISLRFRWRWKFWNSHLWMATHPHLKGSLMRSLQFFPTFPHTFQRVFCPVIHRPTLAPFRNRSSSAGTNLQVVKFSLLAFREW